MNDTREKFWALRGEFAIVLLLLLLAGGVLDRAWAQELSDNQRLQARPEEQLSKYWEVHEAGFREQLTGTVGYIKLKNISERRLRDTIFYGEYFDAAGRLCLSLVFAMTEHEFVEPNDSRLIDSVAFGSFPAVQPAEVRLYLVQIGVGGRENGVQRWDVNLRAPVTIRGSGTGRIEVDPSMIARGQGLIDLMAARVTIDKTGMATLTNTLGGVPTSQIGPWLHEFVERKATFYPRTEGGSPQESDLLILVRVVANESITEPFVPPSESPWVSSYVRNLKDSVPPVIALVFARPPTRVKPLGSEDFVDRPSSPPGVFELLSGESYWSEPPVRWVQDPKMPHNRRMEIALSKPQ